MGAGKTTVLLQLVPWLIRRSTGGDTPVVVLENEMSLTDVDARRLRDNGLTVRELTAGCVCCTARGQLSEAAEKIARQFDPAFLVVEATGMAYPDAVADVLAAVPEVESVRILALADACRWEKLMLAMPAFVSSQMSRADTVLLNKIDAAPEAAVNKALQSIRELTDTAAIYPVSALRGVPENCFENLL